MPPCQKRGAGRKAACCVPWVPVQKDTILRDDIFAMIATLPHDLRGLRDRTILLLGYAGGLHQCEIVSIM
jgi:site-specific recombinase XerD